MNYTEWLEENFFEQDRRMVTAEMAFNAAQKLEREACAKMCNEIAGGKSIGADQLRATNRLVEKRKRKQYRHSA